MTSKLKLIVKKHSKDLEKEYNLFVKSVSNLFVKSVSNLFVKSVSKVHNTQIRIAPKSWVAIIMYDD